MERHILKLWTLHNLKWQLAVIGGFTGIRTRANFRASNTNRYINRWPAKACFLLLGLDNTVSYNFHSTKSLFSYI